jgi:hypothetical protein
VPAAASTWVAERLAGSPRDCAIVASGPHAVYVDVDGDCVGLLARPAVAVPIGLRTTLPRLPTVAEPVRVGDGRLAFEGYDVVPTRIVDPAVPRIEALPPWPASVRLDLPAPALRALADAEATAVLGLLGRGDGLTPSGDDVLAGWLVARYAIGRPSESVGAAVATHAADRTTVLSATLLRRAVAGEALPECRDLLLALRNGAGVEAARDRLLAIGHTSGAALALGISLASGAAV